jgi:hypothetical protein
MLVFKTSKDKHLFCLYSYHFLKQHTIVLFRILRGKVISILIRSIASYNYKLTENGDTSTPLYYMFMWLTTSWEANGRLATQEIPRFLWKPKVHSGIISSQYPVTLFCYDPFLYYLVLSRYQWLPKVRDVMYNSLGFWGGRLAFSMWRQVFFSLTHDEVILAKQLWIFLWVWWNIY